MSGPGSQEPHIIKSALKVPPSAGEHVWFEPVPFDRERRTQQRSMRIRAFPPRSPVIAAPHKDASRKDAARDGLAHSALPAAMVTVEHLKQETANLPQASPREASLADRSGRFSQSALQVIARTGRLTCDATLLLVFSPVIAVWWLLERRHRKGGR